MKKFSSFILPLVLTAVFAFTSLAQKQESNVIGQFKKEVTVEVQNEEELLNYPRNPDYKYTFFIPSSVQPRTICYNCGAPYLGLGKLCEEYLGRTVGCPMNQYSSDIFGTWANWDVEMCTACSMQNKLKKRANTYSSWCNALDKDYEVKKSYTLEKGCDIHEVYDYWINPSTADTRYQSACSLHQT